MPEIAVIIPCYNEAQTIAKVIADHRKALPEATIYVYDNNSTDATALIAKAEGAVVRHEPRQGKGNVVRRMFADIDADVYLLVDGDDTYPAESDREMVELVLNQGVDMVIGDRLSSTYFEQNTRAFHGFGNRLVRLLINKIFSAHIRDIMTGYRAMSRRFVKNLPILSKGFEIETEMTVHALDKNFIIKEIPVAYRDRPEGSVSKLNTFSDGFRILGTIFSLFRDYRPLSFFSILSAITVVVAAVLFIPVFLEYLHTGLVPRFPTLIVAGFMVILAVILFFIGMVLDVIRRKHRILYELHLLSHTRSK